MSKVGRNDPCKCGSGIKYKHCHAVVDNANPKDKYFASQKMYLNQWRHNAKSFEGDGDYDWMARIATQSNPKKILDIGCGTGAGIKALINTIGQDISIVGVDENPHCLSEAYSEIRQTGINIVRNSRISSIIDPINEYFRIDHGNTQIQYADPGCTLIESNICDDQALVSSLKSHGEFDLITVWLVGTHQWRNMAHDVKGQGWIRDVKDYRLYVQNTSYDLAESLLKTGGVLNIVDRGFDNMEENLFAMHREQTSTTSLKIDNIESRPYDPSKCKIGVQMITNNTGVSLEEGKHVLTSITAIKP